MDNKLVTKGKLIYIPHKKDNKILEKAKKKKKRRVIFQVTLISTKSSLARSNLVPT